MDYYDIIAMQHQQLITGSSFKEIQSIAKDVVDADEVTEEINVK